jgi:FkbM family methyltransferase
MDGKFFSRKGFETSVLYKPGRKVDRWAFTLDSRHLPRHITPAARAAMQDPILKRYHRNFRDRWVTRFLDTRHGRNLLIKAISPRTLAMTVDLGDHVMTFSPSDYIGRSIFAKGHFDRDHVGRLLDIMRERGLPTEGKVLLELGGNIGTHTVYFALTGAFARIVTVEPDPRNFPHLLMNIAQNGFAAIVTPINCAAGEAEGEIDFFLHPTNHGRSSPVRRNDTDIRISVPVKPVPAIMEEAGVTLEDVGLVWMDIEGYEPVAIRAMAGLLARRVPIYTEFSPEFCGPGEAAAFIRDLAEFYEDCLVFFEDVRTPMKVRDIPVGKGQFDILLLP